MYLCVNAESSSSRITILLHNFEDRLQEDMIYRRVEAGNISRRHYVGGIKSSLRGEPIRGELSKSV